MFTNPDFENDPVGATPSGWTVASNLNPAITDTRPNPQTYASLNLASGGVLMTKVVGGAAESQVDPDIGASGSFRFPKYGVRAARVNYGDATNNGKAKNVNTLRQTMTVSLADVDPVDDQVHIRFAIAPVLEDPAHAYTEQPYYFVRLQNLTTNTTAYGDFQIANISGIPWKAFTDASGNSASYVDWALVDVSPGNAAIAIGDSVELTVIAAGCSRNGHWGRIYVDSFGENIPGLYTWTYGPQVVNAGGSMTYKIYYRNGGQNTTYGTHLDFVTPPNTTYVSTTGSSCTAPAVGATGTVVCQLGTLAPGATGFYTITVNVPSATTVGTVINDGNYAISATNVSPLIGSKISTTVTAASTAYSDVQVSITDNKSVAPWGSPTQYTITVTNAGPIASSSVAVADTMPAQLTGVTWTCAATGGATCTAAGSGNISDTIALPVGATATYTVNATIIAGSGTGSVKNKVTATVSGASSDPDSNSNAAVDTTALGNPVVLSVTKTSAAALGIVRTAPSGLNCGTSCTSTTGTFVEGATVTLQASPSTGATFVGWTGDCSGTTDCTLTMSQARNVSAKFAGAPASAAPTGGGQRTNISTAFAQPLTLTITDSAGTPIPGVQVTFAVPGSGQSATLSSTTATSDAQGVVSVTATANATPGAYVVSATVPSIASPVTFAMSNLGPPTAVNVVSGTPQSATVATGFLDPLIVEVRDAANQLLPDIAVTFTGPPLGASMTPTPTTILTGPTGQGSLAVAANTIAGTYVVNATVSGVSTPAAFTLTNTAGMGTVVSVVSGDGQSTTVATAYGAPFVAQLNDAFGNPVPGATLTFTAPSSGATATLSTPAATDASGQTSVTGTAGQVAGSFTITASYAGASSATFTATATAGAPASITIQSGNGQQPTVNTVFGQPLSVIVRDAFGNPVPGATVAFSAPVSGASASVPPTATTGSDGVAAITPTAGTVAGSYAITASIAGVPVVQFTATNLAGAAANVAVQSGSEQSAKVTTAYASPLVAIVTDAFGNPVSGVSVGFSAPGSGASATVSPTSATTDASGLASTTATANTVAGPFAVTASISGASTTFPLTNTPDVATSIVAISGAPQSAPVTTAFGAPFIVEVRDQYGNPVPNVQVAVTTPSSGASATPNQAQVTTGNNGRATITATANTVSGTYELVATAAGVSAPAKFALTNLAGAATQVVVVSGGGQSATVNTAFAAPLVAVVRDVYGNPVEGVTVSFAAPGGAVSALLSPASAMSGADGQVQTTATARTATGDYNVTASISGGASTTFALTNKPGVAATITAISGGEQSATVNTAFAAPLIVEVRDEFGNLVPDAVVTLAAPASGASATVPATITTGSDGRAQVTPTAGTVAGAYNVTATIAGENAIFPLTNTAAAASAIRVVSGGAQSTTVLQALAAPIVLEVTDQFGNPIPNIRVSLRAPDAGGPTIDLVDTILTTGSDGRITTTGTAGRRAGDYAITASFTSPAPGASVTVNETSVAAAPATVRPLPGGSPQAQQLTLAFASPLVVVVEDAYGNACSGASVAFAAPATGARATFDAAQVTTDAAGRAQVTATAASAAGTYFVVATTGAAEPAAFTLTNTADPPTRVIASAGSLQSVQVGDDFLLALDALVLDGAGQPRANAMVTFLAPDGGPSGTLAASTVMTDANGHATVLVHANTVAGSYAIIATTTDAMAPARFELTNVPGPVVAIVAAPAAASQSAQTGTQFAAPLVVRAVDAYGNPVPGATITYSAPASGASTVLSATTAVTDAAGRATVTATAGTTGSYSVTASTPGAPDTSFTLNNTATAPRRLTVRSGSLQATGVTSGFAQPLIARLQEADGTPVVGVAVNFATTGSSAGAGLAPATAFTDANGDATVFATANTISGDYLVSASTNDSDAPALFSLDNQPGPPATITLAPAGSPQAAEVGHGFTAPLVVEVRDGFGNLVPGVSITVAAPTATGVTAALSSTTVVTGLDGTARVLARAGTTPGTYDVTLTITDLTPLVASLTNLNGRPGGILAVAGSGQRTRATTAFPAPISFRVVDEFGNPIPDQEVSLAVPDSGTSGVLSATTVTTNAEGEAEVTIVANDVPGSFHMRALVAGRAFLQIGLIVDPIPTTTTLTIPSRVPVNQPVTATIAVAAELHVAGGTVELLDEAGRTIATATLDASGTASVSSTLAALGQHELRARYRAQGAFAYSVSEPAKLTSDKDDGELTGAGTDCNAGGGGAGLIVAAALLALRRRRMLPVVAVIAAVVATVRIADAQEAGSRAIARLRPAAADSDWFALDSLSFGGHRDVAIAVTGDYGYRPLVVYNADDSRRNNVDRNQFILHFGGSVSLWQRLRLSANVPVSPFQNGERTVYNAMTLPEPTYAFGDVTVDGDVRVIGAPRGRLRAAIGVRAILPTGSRTNYMSDGLFGGDAHLLVAGTLSHFEYAADGRVVVREKSELAGEQFGSEARYSAAIGARLARDRLVIGPELFGAVALGSNLEVGTPVEVGLSAHYHMSRAFRLGVGGSMGLVHAVGTPASRAMLSLAWQN